MNAENITKSIISNYKKLFKLKISIAMRSILSKAKSIKPTLILISLLLNFTSLNTAKATRDEQGYNENEQIIEQQNLQELRQEVKKLSLKVQALEKQNIENLKLLYKSSQSQNHNENSKEHSEKNSDNSQRSSDTYVASGRRIDSYSAGKSKENYREEENKTLDSSDNRDLKRQNERAATSNKEDFRQESKRIVANNSEDSIQEKQAQLPKESKNSPENDYNLLVANFKEAKLLNGKEKEEALDEIKSDLELFIKKYSNQKGANKIAEAHYWLGEAHYEIGNISQSKKNNQLMNEHLKMAAVNYLNSYKISKSSKKDVKGLDSALRLSEVLLKLDKKEDAIAFLREAKSRYPGKATIVEKKIKDLQKPSLSKKGNR